MSSSDPELEQIRKVRLKELQKAVNSILDDLKSQHATRQFRGTSKVQLVWCGRCVDAGLSSSFLKLYFSFISSSACFPYHFRMRCAGHTVSHPSESVGTVDVRS